MKKHKKHFNHVKDEFNEIVTTSFQSAKKCNYTERKGFKNSSTKNVHKFTTEEKQPINFSVNSSIYDLSHSHTKTSIRKDSMSFNENFALNNSSNVPKKQTQSFPTNNISLTFVSDYMIGDSIPTGPKRIIVSEEIKLKI
jgi:hypothetical protein